MNGEGVITEAGVVVVVKFFCCLCVPSPPLSKPAPASAASPLVVKASGSCTVPALPWSGCLHDKPFSGLCAASAFAVVPRTPSKRMSSYAGCCAHLSDPMFKTPALAGAVLPSVMLSACCSCGLGHGVFCLLLFSTFSHYMECICTALSFSPARHQADHFGLVYTLGRFRKAKLTASAVGIRSLALSLV